MQTNIVSSGGWPKYYTVILLCVIAQLLAYFDRVTISVAAVAMQETYGWSEITKGLVLSSFFVGYMALQIVGGWLANRYGGKSILGICLVLWSIFTLLTPMAASISIGALILVRILMGAGEAALAPSVLNLFSRWVPNTVKARAISIFSASASLGTLLALLLTGWIAHQYGWQMAFYIFGLLGLMLAIVWYRLIYPSPSEHPSISVAELKALPSISKSNKKNVPWRKILTSRAAWAIFLAYFCVNWSLYVFIAWLPSYFTKEQSLDLTNAGFFSAAPWLAMAFFMVVGGWLSDKLIIKGVRHVVVRKIMTAVGLLGSAATMLFMPYASSPMIAMLLMVVALSIISLSYSGVVTNIMDIAPEHTDVVFGFTNTLGTLPGIIGIAIAGWLVEMTSSYASVFWLTATVQITGAMIFLLFASSKKVIG